MSSPQPELQPDETKSKVAAFLAALPEINEARKAATQRAAIAATEDPGHLAPPAPTSSPPPAPTVSKPPTPKPTAALGTTYAVNQAWLAPYVKAHQDLVLLIQLCYDIAPRIFSNKMSTTVYNNLYSNIVIDISLSSYEIDTKIIDTYSSRQFVHLGVSVKKRRNIDFTQPGSDADWATIRTKTNWASTEVNKLRKQHPVFESHTTAKQVEYLANDLGKALCLPRDDRDAAIKRLPESFRVDTRSKLGRPTRWSGFPVNPPQGSAAYFRKQNGKWVLWVENQQEVGT